MAVEDLDLSMRAYNCLRRSGLMTVGQVIETSEEDLLSLRNFGRKSYDELRVRLDELRIFPASKRWGPRHELWKPSDFKYERPRLLDDLL